MCDVVSVGGDDLGLLGDGDNDDRRVYDVGGCRPTKQLPDGVSGRFVEGENLATTQQATQLRLAG